MVAVSVFTLSAGKVIEPRNRPGLKHCCFHLEIRDSVAVVDSDVTNQYVAE